MARYHLVPHIELSALTPITIGPRQNNRRRETSYVFRNMMSIEKPISVGPRRNHHITHCLKKPFHGKYTTGKEGKILSIRTEDTDPLTSTLVTSPPIQPLQDSEEISIRRPKEGRLTEAPPSSYTEHNKICITNEDPSVEIQEKMSFMINNLSSENIDSKAIEFRTILKEMYYPWFARYIVTKRAKFEPNFQDLYLKLIDKVNSKDLNKEILEITYETCKNMLKADFNKSSVVGRSLLNNLGSWLGKITFGKDQALRESSISPKILIIEAYETGSMSAVIPFISKIFESTKKNSAFYHPNPTTVDIVELLIEIYVMENLKLNIVFAIEILFRNLGVDMKAVCPTTLLKERATLVEGNPDFSNKGR